VTTQPSTSSGAEVGRDWSLKRESEYYDATYTGRPTSSAQRVKDRFLCTGQRTYLAWLDTAQRTVI